MRTLLSRPRFGYGARNLPAGEGTCRIHRTVRIWTAFGKLRGKLSVWTPSKEDCRPSPARCWVMTLSAAGTRFAHSTAAGWHPDRNRQCFRTLVENRDEGIPVPSAYTSLGDSQAIALRAAIRSIGLSDDRYELTAALATILKDSKSEQRWLAARRCIRHSSGSERGAFLRTGWDSGDCGRVDAPAGTAGYCVAIVVFYMAAVDQKP